MLDFKEFPPALLELTTFPDILKFGALLAEIEYHCVTRLILFFSVEIEKAVQLYFLYNSM